MKPSIFRAWMRRNSPPNGSGTASSSACARITGRKRPGASFPDIVAAISFEGVIDGELLVMRDGKLASFGELQQRLNRKTPDGKLMDKFPAGIHAYDLLLDGEEDLRGLAFVKRRARLEAFV